MNRQSERGGRARSNVRADDRYRQSYGAAQFPNAESFVAALMGHDDYLRGVAWFAVRDQSALDDIMQETYEKAYRSREYFDGRSSLRTWLHAICYRTAVDHIRRSAARPSVSLEIVADDVAAVPATSTMDGAARRLEAADLLGRLDPEQRMLLYYTSALGYRYGEVAEITGLSRGTIASKVSRAKRRLRRLAEAGSEGRD